MGLHLCAHAKEIAFLAIFFTKSVDKTITPDSISSIIATQFAPSSKASFVRVKRVFLCCISYISCASSSLENLVVHNTCSTSLEVHFMVNNNLPISHIFLLWLGPVSGILFPIIFIFY